MIKKVWKWIVGALITVGGILLYVFLQKGDAQERVAEIEKDIKKIDKEIKEKEKIRKESLKDADDHATAGTKIDKQIEEAKKRQVNLDKKREKMKNLFDKYGA